MIEFTKDKRYPNLLFVVINGSNKAAISLDGSYLKTIGYIPYTYIEQIMCKMKELQSEVK